MTSGGRASSGSSLLLFALGDSNLDAFGVTTGILFGGSAFGTRRTSCCTDLELSTLQLFLAMHRGRRRKPNIIR